jgi:hypothetical protein
MTIRNIRTGRLERRLVGSELVRISRQPPAGGLGTETDEVLHPAVENGDDRPKVTQLQPPQLAGLESRNDRLVDPDDPGQGPLARAGIASGASDDLAELANPVGGVGFGALALGHEAVKHDAPIADFRSADFRSFVCT